MASARHTDHTVRRVNTHCVLSISDDRVLHARLQTISRPTLIMHHAVDCDSSAALAEVAVTTGAEVPAATEDGTAPV